MLSEQDLQNFARELMLDAATSIENLTFHEVAVEFFQHNDEFSSRDDEDYGLTSEEVNVLRTLMKKAKITIEWS